jgi:glycerol-3-phosphate O-acyltransferase
VLTSFLEAYLVVADQLAAAPEQIDERQFVERCLGVAHQQRLQKRLASTESISRELFANALKLARNRGLLDSPASEGSAGSLPGAGTGGGAIAERRGAFRAEMSELVDRVARIRAL